MKTAVLISGQMRTWLKCLPYLNWYVFRKLPNPVFFISCSDDEQAQNCEDGIQKLGHKVHIEKVTQPQLIEPVIPDGPYPMPNSVPIQALLRQMWHLNRVWEFHLSERISFDIYVRCRPDLLFHRFQMPRGIENSYEARTPWWSSYGGVNDKFAILGSKAAPHYFRVFNNIGHFLNLGCPFHPETLIYESMLAGGVGLRQTLVAEFSTLRMNGERVWPLYYPSDYFQYLHDSIEQIGASRTIETP